jgi:hypothetical protein
MGEPTLLLGLLWLAPIIAGVMAAAQEGWKSSGFLEGPGIPAPTGQYRVGCVDLMHQLPGDEEKGGLLVRLTYPTEATPGAGYPYSSWYPDRRYIKGYLTMDNAFGGFLSFLVNTFTRKTLKIV